MGNLNVYCVIKLIQRIQSLIGFVAHVSQEIFIVAQYRKELIMDLAEVYELNMLEKEIDNCQKVIEILDYMVCIPNLTKQDLEYINKQIMVYQKRLHTAKEELDYENKAKGIC